MADGAALCLGAVLGGFVPVLAGARLRLLVVVAAALAPAHTGAVLWLVVSVGTAAQPAPRWRRCARDWRTSPAP